MRWTGRRLASVGALAFAIAPFGCTDELEIPIDSGAPDAGTAEAPDTAAPDSSEPDGGEPDALPEGASDFDATPDTPDGPLGIGQPCTQNSDCPTGVCIDPTRHPMYAHGYCTIFGCSPANNAGCPPDAECRGMGAVGNTACFLRCTETGGCPDASACCKANPDAGESGFCAPATVQACL